MGDVRYQPVIIIGTGRSGTNMLRDTITKIDGFGSWPCDEINYIWRHGNIKEKNDEFKASHATPRVRSYIRKKFDQIAKKNNLKYVVEKTCANSLRVEFINTILPEAKYIYIVRDGRDVVSSAKKRWTASLDLKYILKKARYVPMLDLPFYGINYIYNRVYRLFSGEKRLAFWGPKFKGMENVLENYSLEEVCAIQWKNCVDHAEQAFQNIEPERVHKICYEDFVKNPVHHMEKICRFLGTNVSKNKLEELVKDVSPRSVGKGKRSMNDDVLGSIEHLTKDTLQRHHYV